MSNKPTNLSDYIATLKSDTNSLEYKALINIDNAISVMCREWVRLESSADKKKLRDLIEQELYELFFPDPKF